MDIQSAGLPLTQKSAASWKTYRREVLHTSLIVIQMNNFTVLLLLIAITVLLILAGSP